MKKIIRLAKLIWLILRKGKFRHSGYDYARVRKKMLVDLGEFCPSHALRDPHGNFLKNGILKNQYLNGWFSEAALLKHALKSRAGHLWVPKLNLAYIRNPRAASTALAFTLLNAHFPHLKNFSISAEKINFLTDVNLREELSHEERQATFLFVSRNPFARIVSVYREFVERQSANYLFEDYLFGILPKDLSFKEFVKLLHLIPDVLKDQHLKPQHTFLKYYLQKNVSVTILKLEEASELLAVLSRFHLTLDAINKSKTAYDYRQYYDKETLQYVYRVYCQDISRFGYEAVYEGLRQSLR